MFFSGKRGSADEELWKFIFELLMLAAVIISMFFYVSARASDDAIFKEYYARDLGLLLDTMQSVPGEIELGYEVRDDLEGDFDFRFSDGWVYVYSTGSSEPTHQFPYAVSPTTDQFPRGEKISSANKFVIAKGDSIEAEVLNE